MMMMMVLMVLSAVTDDKDDAVNDGSQTISMITIGNDNGVVHIDGNNDGVVDDG